MMLKNKYNIKMNKTKNYTTFIFFLQILYVISPIPNWDISAQSINLLTSTSYDYPLYSKNENGVNVFLKKTITKTDSGITTQNYITIGSTTQSVEFEDIDSQYTSKLGCDILICPRGKFHPYNFKSNTYITPPNFEDKGGWDLRCYNHNTGYFLVLYLSNKGKNLFYKYGSENIKEISSINTYIYDFKLENGNSKHNYEFKFSFLQYHTDNGIIYLIPGSFTMNTDENNYEAKYNCIGSWKEIITSKNYTQGSFASNHFFYFLTYNDATDFKSGYSDKYVDFSSKEIYQNCINTMTVTINENSPLSFVDNVEIKEMKFITGTKYAYYKIYNSNKNKYYYGLIDIKTNKVLYNFEEEITSFLPVSSSEMLAITKTSAYKVCIIKSGDSCSESCSDGNNLILDPEGNKCGTQSECANGKVQLMPEGTCINKASCDTNYYTLNSDETQCGLCSYFYPDGNKYKLVNTTGCIATIPNNADFYKEEYLLLKCKTNYHLNSNNECVPEICYESCASCSEVSSDANDQKCTSCKAGFTLDNGNCITIPTTVIIPPTTMLIPPTTVIKPPTTVIIPPTTVIIPPTTVIIPPTTVIIPPTTVITPPTTIPITVPEIICPLEKCLTCNQRSLSHNLCLTCNEALGYKKVNYTIVLTEFVDCFKPKDPFLKNYYYNETLDEYRPCYKTCKRCLKGGNAEFQHCLECETNYMFRPGDNPYNNCVAYSEYYYIDPYDQYKSLNSLKCPPEAKYLIKEKNMCIYDCKKDKEYKYLYNGQCLKNCPSDTRNNSFQCIEISSKSYLGVNDIHLEENDDLKVVDTFVLTYISEFNYTNNHATLYNSESYSILLYKNPKILNDLSLKMSKVDFQGCYDKVKNTYGIEEDLITTVVDKKSTNNPASYYSFFHPKSGQKLEAENICKNDVIIVKENLSSILNENDSNYELQTSLTSQGINIFDMNDPFYTDLCFDFDNPQKRDIPLSDRIKNVFPNVTLCGEGCQIDGINLEDMTSKCNCKFNDIANNQAIKDNAVLDSAVGEIFDLINSSNILVVKCYNKIFKYFKNSIGGILTTSIIGLDLILTYIFVAKQFPKIASYIISITKRYLAYLSGMNAPPKRLSKRLEKEENKKIKNRKSLKNDKKKEENNLEKKYIITATERKEMKKNERKSSEKLYIKNLEVNEVTYNYLDEKGIIKKFVEEYFETSPDEMEYDDAIKKDHRTFCQYFAENLKEKQIIANTFIANDPIKPRSIKIILFSLNIILYFVINGLFISEEYISELYYINEEEENFFSFLPRSIERLIYTTIVSLVIGYLTGFFFLEEKKVKGIFKRDMENKTVLKENIKNLIKSLKKRYISFIIVVFVILLLSLYYLLCFNYVYPKTQIEWIKSSIAIIIIIQILSILLILLETIIRFLSFKCESEKLFKVSQFLS